MLLKHCILTIVCVMVIGLFSFAEAQQFTEDVIYLKNGSVVRGIIVEQIPSETLRIRTKGGSEFVFKMSDVLKITKELPIVEPPGPVPPSTYIKEKDPTLAFILSFLLVGTGQLYVEEYSAAYTHWLVAIGSLVLIVTAAEDDYSTYDPDGDNVYGGFGLLVMLTNWVVSMVSAPSQAHAFNEKQHLKRGVSLLENRLFLKSYTSGEAQGALLSLRF